MSDYDKLSEAFEKGMKNALQSTLHTIFIMFCIFSVSVFLFSGAYKKDDTDSNEKRSGMALRTDNATGCQYLESQRGGITPRLSKGGIHHGCYK